MLAHLSEFPATHNHPLVFMGAEFMRSNFDYHSDIEESLTSLHIDATQIEMNASYFNHAEIYQTLLYCKEDKESLHRNNLQSLNFIRWHEYAMDVLPLGGSKAKGIEKFIEKKGFTKNKVMLLVTI